jgi:hypothetical protein
MSARGDWRPILSNAIASDSNGRDAPLSGFADSREHGANPSPKDRRETYQESK